MIFFFESCPDGKGILPQLSLRVRPELKSLKMNDLPYTFYMSSFRDCTAVEMGPKISVTVYDSQMYKGNVATFSDMCACEELPVHFWGKTLSVKNNGNCIIVYHQSNCQGRSFKAIQGGINFATDEITIPLLDEEEQDVPDWPFNLVKYTRRAKSIAPCDDLPQHCFG